MGGGHQVSGVGEGTKMQSITKKFGMLVNGLEKYTVSIDELVQRKRFFGHPTMSLVSFNI